MFGSQGGIASLRENFNAGFHSLKPLNALMQIFDTCRDSGIFEEENLGSQSVVNGSCSFAFWLEVCKLSPLKQKELFLSFWRGYKGNQCISAVSLANRSHPLVFSSWDKK